MPRKSPASFVKGTLEERLFGRLIIGDGCWEMAGYHDEDGYAQISSGGCGGSTLRAHRVTYEMFRGPIPTELEPDHLCRNPGCVNPWCIELVTTRDNVLRSEGPAAVNARKTHCVHGHEFTPSNTWTNGKRRQCKTCLSARARRYKGGDDSHATV
jgi:hypothetical protein